MRGWGSDSYSGLDNYITSTEGLAQDVDEDEREEDTCGDCGEPGEHTGHMGCQYPRDRA